ncbi:uncharacterized protein L201_001212 [Kwoniella dendrophila CBS 6074]|uniref:EF-TsMt n=1 Tax=Kwoniella dendrophila CBS 6074 TaxID=1295534 RepID=A0AAX4JLQ3_9TREE
MSILIPKVSSSFRSNNLLSLSSLTSSSSRYSISTSCIIRNNDKIKVPISLIANLRKEFPVPLSQAREALEKTNLNLKNALEYLKNNTSSSAAAEKKAEKVSGRITNEGVISISLLKNKRVGMIHLGCETDFVARNKVFLNTAKNISETTAFLDVPPELENHNHHHEDIITNNEIKPGQDPILSFPIESLLSAPLITLPSDDSTSSETVISSSSSEPQTIKQTLLSSLSQTGENLKLLRATSFASPFPSKPEIRYIPSGYTHGGLNDKQGKIGGIIVLSVESLNNNEQNISNLIHSEKGEKLENDLNEFARIISRQVVGFPTKVIENQDNRPLENDEILYQQPFMMYKGDSRPVKQVIQEWGNERGIIVKVVGMRRWAVGDELESSPTEKEAESTI